MMATIELEFKSAGETTHNAMDQALIRGLEALKNGIELRDNGTPRRAIKPTHKMEHRTEIHLLAPQVMRLFPPPRTGVVWSRRQSADGRR